MIASKELMDKKLSASEFLQRCSFRQKNLPHCVIDTTDKYINSMEDDDSSDGDNNPEADINTPYTLTSTATNQPSTSSNQNTISQCVCCWFAKPSVLALPCKHVASCNTSCCWSIVKQGFVDRLLSEEGIDFFALEKRAREDPEFKIPATHLPKCPYCRAPVETSITDVYIP